MLWFLLFFLTIAALIVVALRRALRVARSFQDPESLRELLSPDVRIALDRASIRLDADGMAKLRESEELTRLVTTDLRRAFVRAILAAGAATPGRTRTPAAAAISGASLGVAALGNGPDRSEVPGLPPPIDAVPSSKSRAAVLVSAVAGVAGAAIWLLARG